MDKNKKTLIILLILIPIGVFVYWPKDTKKRSTVAISETKTKAGITASSVKEAVVKAVEEIDKKKLMGLLAQEKEQEKKKVLPEQWGERNPFDVSDLHALAQTNPVRVEENVLPVEKLVVMGMLWGGSKPSVIINDKVLGVGDNIDGWTVKQIRESTVVLTNGINEVVLTMWQ
ncbi:MAG TPA: hypothetical protein PLH56_05010 [Candidatus Omnitrophota bacterium]|nr:hypothetical protein [Candidatus Omnitrophota bacterium]